MQTETLTITSSMLPFPLPHRLAGPLVDYGTIFLELQIATNRFLEAAADISNIVK